MPKAYPVYAVGYKRLLKTIKDYLEQFENLETIGRGGRFRYDNMDVAIASGISASRKIVQPCKI